MRKWKEMYKKQNDSIEAYCFDWDDNIIKMDTKIYLEKKQGNGEYVEISVSTTDFALLRNNPEYRYPNNNINLAMRDFRDWQDEDVFLKDLRIALANKDNLKGSFVAFKECILGKNPFSIITARGHAPNKIKEGVRILIEDILISKNIEYTQDELTDYVKEQKFYPVSSHQIIGKIEYTKINRNIEINKEDVNIEENKWYSFEHFVNFLLKTYPNKNIEIGFSDDDIRNIKHMKEMVLLNKEKYPVVSFFLYNTIDPKNIKIERL